MDKNTYKKCIPILHLPHILQFTGHYIPVDCSRKIDMYVDSSVREDSKRFVGNETFYTQTNSRFYITNESLAGTCCGMWLRKISSPSIQQAGREAQRVQQILHEVGCKVMVNLWADCAVCVYLWKCLEGTKVLREFFCLVNFQSMVTVQLRWNSQNTFIQVSCKPVSDLNDSHHRRDQVERRERTGSVWCGWCSGAKELHALPVRTHSGRRWWQKAADTAHWTPILKSQKNWNWKRERKYKELTK